MELLERLSQSLTAKGRLLNQLAILTGRMQGLVDRIERHAEVCAYPQMKFKLVEVAVKGKAHVKLLNGILSDSRVWAKLPEHPAHEGINNWERISGDLTTLARLNVDLNGLAVKWMPVEADISERIRTVINEQVPMIDALQEVAARSDPQAID
jgi:hypothetical protein